MIAALYIDPRGPYPTMPGVLACGLPDCNALEYQGPHPIIAHPPCGPWSSLRHLYEGAEHDCAVRAVEQVRRWGGVLEHPYTSNLWHAVIEPTRSAAPYFRDEYTVVVDQCEWGHVARKRTKLFLVGIPRSALEPPPFPGRVPTHWASGRRGMPVAIDNVPPGIKVCSAQQRRRTPKLFAEYLVRLAASVQPKRA